MTTPWHHAHKQTTDDRSTFYHSKQIKPKVPLELYKDFMRLGLAPGASLDICKNAQKNLLKKHHPDRHSESVYSFNIATQITSSINESFQRIALWYKKGIVEDM